jgi:DNA-binding SARP family transcriptional activator
MTVLEIKLFGPVEISHDNWKTKVNTTRIIQGLLAYLLLQRHRTHSREGLVSLFWADQNEEKARGCLNTTLWRLRTVLEPSGITQGTYLLREPSGSIGFNWESPYWLDVAIFEDEIHRILGIHPQSIEKADIQKLEDVLQLYNGDLLEGFYDDWVLREREKLRSLYLNSLAYLMKYEMYQGMHEKALSYAAQILEIDPLREEIHREMMRIYVDNQQRTLAIRQFNLCSDILKTELGILPMEETRNLYDQILSTEKLRPTDLPKSKENEILGILNDLQQVAQSLEQMQKQLTQEIEFLQNYFKEKSVIPRPNQ